VSWTGCGQHVDQIMAGVKQADRCTCPRPEPGSFFKRLFGR